MMYECFYCGVLHLSAHEGLCPHCGGNLELAERLLTYKCFHCGAFSSTREGLCPRCGGSLRLAERLYGPVCFSSDAWGYTFGPSLVSTEVVPHTVRIAT